MCGIVGAVAQRNIVPILIEGLRKLEYRGYDSAGIALLGNDGKMERVRAVGRVAELEHRAEEQHADAPTGIAHTRWATHGGVNEGNAHPHISTGSELQICVVHNGIIENHEELRSALKARGYTFTSQTDTEVVAHLVHSLVLTGLSLTDAVAAAVKQLHGAYALAVISSREPGTVVGTRRGSPLLLGVGGQGTGKGENFLASDTSALLQVTKHVVYLDEGDLVTLTRDGYTIRDADGKPATRQVTESQLSADAVELGTYDHYMQKEIFEQPGAIGNTLEMIEYASSLQPGLFGAEAEEIFRRTRRILILACGTSYHAGFVAKYWLESIARIPTDVEIASEYRYRDPVPQDDTLVITISQSGETADTLAALFLLTLVLAKMRGHLSPERESDLLAQMRHLPAAMNHVLAVEPAVKEWAKRFAGKDHALFLGRDVNFPIAMEGALKLKEITYIHAEAYAAGELKHGPLALVDANMPVVVVAPKDALIEKLKSNIQEVRARGGELFVFADKDTHIEEEDFLHVINLVDHAGPLSPILHVVPLQLLSYHAALARGTDVDKPRNLAKSVTVE